jgi:Zn-dependent protease with chaperone function
LWHVTLLKKAARMKWLRRLYTYVAVPTLSFFAVWAPVVLVSDLTRGAGNFSGLAVLFFPVFVLLGYLYVNRLWKWPFEYECDEAAVRFMGASPTREFLRTFRLKSGWRSHPPARKRLERVDEETSRFPVPVINFASLQRDVRQEFVFK